MEKIKRSLFATFINTTPGDGEATWAKMGKGITISKEEAKALLDMLKTQNLD